MSKRARVISLILTTILFLSCSLFFYSQQNLYLLSKELLNTIQNEVSGERAWDMVSNISRFHRNRGGGKGSDYNRCVEFLEEELRKIGLKDIKIKRYLADGSKKNFLWRSLVGWRVKEAELWLLEPHKKFLKSYIFHRDL